MDTRQALLGGVAAVALGAGLLGAPVIALAQQAAGTYTTQTGYHADAATLFQMVAGGRTTCSTTQDTVANLTITVPAVAGNYFYLTGVYIQGQSNATGATSTTVWSSTNLSGSPAWLTPTIATAAANPSAIVNIAEVYPTGLRSTLPGTAVTILPQATTSSAFFCAHVTGFYNPT